LEKCRLHDPLSVSDAEQSKGNPWQRKNPLAMKRRASASRLIDRLYQWARSRPDQIAFTLAQSGQEVSLTYGQLAETVASRTLTNAPTGCRVFIQQRSPLDQVQCFLAAINSGLVPCLLPYGVDCSPILSAFGDAIVWSESLPEVPASARAKDGPQPTYLVLGGGTSGPPKALGYREEAIVSQLVATEEAFALTPDDILVSWLPLHHNFGLFGNILTPIWMGFQTVLLSATEWMANPRSYLQLITRHGGTISSMPNFGFAHTLRSLRPADLAGLDLSTLRTLGTGAEPIQREVMEGFAAMFSHCGLNPAALRCGYGLSEFCYCCTSTDVGQGLRSFVVDGRESVSCGKPIPGTHLRIVDPDGAVLEEGQVGLIEVKGPSLFSGYEPSSDGGLSVTQSWLETQDIGYLRDGELYVHGRAKEIIIVGGRNCYPEEIERVAGFLLGCPAVAVGLAGLGTEQVALVCETELADGPSLSEAAAKIRGALQQRLGLHLQELQFRPPGWLVRSPSGKLARYACKAKYLAESKLSPSSLELAVRRILAQQAPEIALSTELNWFEAGIASLRLVHILATVERECGRPIPLIEFSKAPTTDTLLRLLSEKDSPAEIPPGSDKFAKPERSGPISKLQQLWARGPIVKGMGLNYRVGAKALGWFTEQSMLQKLFYGETRNCMEEVLSGDFSPELVAANWRAYLWSGWRTEMLRRPQNRELLVYKNWQVFEAAQSDPGGTLFVLHHTPFSPWFFNRLDPGREQSAIGNLKRRGLLRQGLTHLKSDPESDSPTQALLGPSIASRSCESSSNRRLPSLSRWGLRWSWSAMFPSSLLSFLGGWPWPIAWPKPRLR
jgi:acyl-CoA synthetase (AMP-forming)/AMP-acid ligase II